MSQQLFIPAPGIQANFKPDFPVEIDRNSPIANNLKFYYFNGQNLDTGNLLSGSAANGFDIRGRVGVFDGSTTGFSDNKSAIIPNFPFSLAATVKFTSNTTTETAIGLGTATSGYYAVIDLSGTESGQPLRVLSASGSNYRIQYYATVALNTWVNLIAIFDTPISYRLYLDGVLQTPTSTPTSSSYPAPVFTSFDIGVSVQGSPFNRMNGEILWGAAWQGSLPLSAVAALQQNAYQLLRPKQRDLWIPVSSTPSNNLVGTSAENQSASAGLSIAVPMVAASVQTQSSSGVLSTIVPLSGNATATQSASGALQITVPLNAQAIQQQAASGSMSISVTLAGNAIQEGYNTGALTNTASGTIALVGTSGQQQSASGLLSIGVSPSGASLAVQSASGNLTTLVSLTGSSVQAHQASGGLIVTVNLNAEELQSQSAAASMTLRINLNAESVQQAIAQGYLSLNGTLTPDPRYTINALGRTFTVNALGRTFTL